MAATFYVCTYGEIIIRGMQTFAGPDATSHLVRFIALNLSKWEQIKPNSALEYGLIRTLFLALSTCSAPAFYEKAAKEEMTAIIWHMAKFLESVFLLSSAME
jgi:hypothetical protein